MVDCIDPGKIIGQIRRKLGNFQVDITARQRRIPLKKETDHIDTLQYEPTVPSWNDFPYGGDIFKEFQRRVNGDHLHVLEIGSRIVTPGSTSKRSLFHNAASYTGFDYYKDDNTDVVGDAHRLSRYFQSHFNAIFSIAVLEHIAIPWVFVMELNKLLEKGGITYHETLFSWPLHERPWDFWRFSDQGLKVLFSPAMGFRVLNVGFFHPVKIFPHPMIAGQETMVDNPAFGCVAILAEKYADINPQKFTWNTGLDEILGAECVYPHEK
jgi:hypothetical protein